MQIKQLIGRYEAHLKTIGRALHTIRIIRYNLRSFARYLEGEGILGVEQLTREVIEDYQYDTAIRRAELSGIRMHDIDADTGFILVTGKGDRQRVVPVSGRVCELVQNYLRFVRPALASAPDHGYLMVNDKGDPMQTHTVWRIVKACAQQARIKKNVTTHTFRHACATHMLKNGAPIRHLQEMLGHASLESTQIYTRVTINDLKEVHAKYHPGTSPINK